MAANVMGAHLYHIVKVGFECKSLTSGVQTDIQATKQENPALASLEAFIWEIKEEWHFYTNERQHLLA